MKIQRLYCSGITGTTWDIMDMWCKHTNFEQANHSALMFRHPDLFSETVVSQPVELLDIFPTLVDFAGLEMPEMLQG